MKPRRGERVVGLWDTRMGLGRECQPGYWLMDADLAAYKAGNEALASCCLCELGDLKASIRIWKCWHRDELRDMQ